MCVLTNDQNRDGDCHFFEKYTEVICEDLILLN